MITDHDQPFLRRALRLAMNGRGHVEPNPMVGCVIAKNGQIIGEGWHEKFGGPHAEPNALADCKAKGNDPAGATAYVTLEPCCHENKKTPPCAPRLIEAKLARVVIGCLDPNPAVNGNGVAMLRAAGIEVEVLAGARPYSLAPVPGGEGWGEGESARGRPVSSTPQATSLSPQPSPPGTGERELDGSHFQQLIAPFILRTKGDTYRTLKWTETSDGTLSGPARSRLQISNAVSSRVVHALRGRCDAIVVGIGTVLKDDPLLTPRNVDVRRLPHRYVLDSSLRIPANSQLVRTAREVSTTVICDLRLRGDRKFEKRATLLREAGVVVDDDVPSGKHGLDLHEAIHMGSLRANKSHVLFEPGPTLGAAVLPLVQRLWIFRSSSVSSPHGVPALKVPNNFTAVASIDLAGDTLTEYLNTASPAFFAAVPSADFVLARESAASSVA